MHHPKFPANTEKFLNTWSKQKCTMSRKEQSQETGCKKPHILKLTKKDVEAVILSVFITKKKKKKGYNEWGRWFM